MRIKNHPNKNQYLLTASGLWVRDFTRPDRPYLDINTLTGAGDYDLLLQNEVTNRRLNMQHIDTEDFNHPGAVIVSDGYGFGDRHRVLAGLPKEVAVIAVNGALSSWQLVAGDQRQRIHYYVVNNPYPECMNFFPRENRYFPRCIASARTHPEFLRQYAKRGTMYRYMPTPDRQFSGLRSDALYHIDDYRNPICAAVGLAFRFGVRKLLLFGCDDSFADERPAAARLENGLYSYPQQEVSHSLIDACLHWMRTQEDSVEVASHSSGPEYRNAPYIEPDGITRFFERRNGKA